MNDRILSPFGEGILFAVESVLLTVKPLLTDGRHPFCNFVQYNLLQNPFGLVNILL
jgi:hypothetical protein